MDISFDYLQALLTEVNALRENFPYRELNENDYDAVIYIANKNDTRIGVQQGLRQVLACQKHHFRETERIRANSKNYCKLYKKQGKTVRVESFVKGRLDVVFLAHYTEDKRFLFPFSEAGGFYPTYTYVTHFSGDLVDEEYYADGHQIVYERYHYHDDQTAGYDFINYVPAGTAPVLSRASGVFILKPELQYHADEYVTWRDGETRNSVLSDL